MEKKQLKLKTTQKLLSVYPSEEEPQGVFIGTRGKGPRGTTPSPKYGHGHARTAVKTWSMPRFYGSSRVARRAYCHALSCLSPVGCNFRFLVLGPWF